MTSIRRTLLLALTATIFLTCLAVGLWSYQETTHEVEELFDAELAQVTRVLQGLLPPQSAAQDLRRLQQTLQKFDALASQQPVEEDEEEDYYLGLPGHRYESKIAFQVWHGGSPELLSVHPRLLPIPTKPAEGFGWAESSSHRWRTFTLYDPVTRFWIRSSQRGDIRQELTDELAESMLWPLLYMLPALLVAIFVVITWGLKPLRLIEGRVRSLQPEQLQPIALQRTPQEVQSLVSSLNQLLERLRNALAREKQFTADAAHELRTPLAALKLHLQNAQYQEQPDLPLLLDSVERMSHLVEQLLTLSRLDPQDQLQGTGPVDLTQLAENALAEMAPLALAKDIEPVLESDRACVVDGDPALLMVLLRNLIDNSIRYSSPHTEIEVSVKQQATYCELRVEDQGPGIASADRERVMQRFVRGPVTHETGSGLGLSIVQRIVRLHGAQLTLGDRDNGTGLSVRIVFPCRTSPP